MTDHVILGQFKMATDSPGGWEFDKFDDGSLS